jgi:hypothetical protein
MKEPAEYRENAALCLEAMRAAEVPEVKESLQTLAQRWIDLADRAERSNVREGRSGAYENGSSHLVARNPWQRF